MDTKKYLERIGFQGVLRADFETLCELQRCHLLTVPYENLDVMLSRPLKLDYAYIYDKIVRQHRGGKCHELNAMFHWLLGQVGFKVTMLNCQAYNPFGELSIQFSHMGILVTLDGARYFADAFIQPVKLELDVPLSQISGTYMFYRQPQREDEDPSNPYYYMKCQLTPEAGAEGVDQWENMHRFRIEDHALNEFQAASDHFQSDRGGHVLPKLICTVIKTGKGNSCKMIVANKYRHYVDTQFQSLKRADEKLDSMDANALKGVLLKHFGLECDVTQLKESWDGSQCPMNVEDLV